MERIENALTRAVSAAMATVELLFTRPTTGILLNALKGAEWASIR